MVGLPGQGRANGWFLGALSWATLREVAAFVLGIVVAIVAYLGRKLVGERIDRLISRGTRQLLPIQRVILPRDEGLFDDVWRIYDQPPWTSERRQYVTEWLATPPSSESEEFLFVCRRWFGNVRALLHVTLYKEPTNQAVVVRLERAQSAPEDKFRGDAVRLWRSLEKAVFRSTGTSRCIYYFELPSNASKTHGGILRQLGVQRIGMPYRVPDRGWPPAARGERSATLARLGHSQERSVPREEVLKFIYGVAYWWVLQWPDEVRTLDETKQVLDYLVRLRERVRKRCGPQLRLHLFKP
jgi:hypothetical protein